MKLRNILVLPVLFLGIIGPNVFIEGQDADDYGKLLGWVVDPISGNPVNEVFEFEFYPCDEKKELPRYLAHRKTDENGYMAVELRPNKYCIRIFPESRNSKYSFEPDHNRNDQYYFPVIIERGKITEFRKKATIAGKLRIKLVNTKGIRISPIQEFPKHSSIHISLDSKNLYTCEHATNLSDDDIMEDGEMIVYELFPDIYSIRIVFRRTGFKSLKKKDIKVESGKITDIEFVIDVEDITGVEGKVLDKNGAAVKYAEVTLSPEIAIDGDFTTYTDQYGFYRIKGLPEGLFSVKVSFKSTIYPTIKIKIEKDLLTQKDITIKCSIDDK